MSKIDAQTAEQYFQDSLQEAADSMALEDYYLTDEQKKEVEIHARRDKEKVFKQLDSIFKKDRASVETKAA